MERVKKLTFNEELDVFNQLRDLYEGVDILRKRYNKIIRIITKKRGVIEKIESHVALEKLSLTKDNICKDCVWHRFNVYKGGGKQYEDSSCRNSAVTLAAQHWVTDMSGEVTILECSEFERAEEAKDPAEFRSRNYRKNEKVDQK